ncbi:MAG: hypothetical protein ACP5NQ_06410 [Vulcanisaeta sp.]
MVEVTRVIKIQTGCKECLEFIMKSLSLINGILLMKIFNDELVITYETNNVKFSEIAQTILSLGVGILLRKVIINVGNKKLSIDYFKNLVDVVDGIVDAIYDPSTSRLSILMHPDVDLDVIINQLIGMGLSTHEVVADEVSQVLMARS